MTVINKKKFKIGIQKIALAIALAFTGPILFSFSINYPSYLISLTLKISGIIIMIGCVGIGFLGIRNLLSSFFEPPNE